MSARAMFWAQEQRVKDPIAKLLLLKLADQANDDGVAWPSRRTLAEHIGCHTSLISKKARKLEEQGLIERITRRRQNGSQTSNVYQLHLGEGDLIRSDKGDRIPPDIPGEQSSPEPTQKEERPATAARARTPRDDIWDALVAVCQIDPDTLTSGEKSRVGRSVNELLAVGATPLEIQARAVRYRQKYEGAALTDRALVNHWSEFSGRRRQGLLEESCPECDLSMTRKKLREHRFTIHGVGTLCTDCGEVTVPEEEHACQAKV